MRIAQLTESDKDTLELLALPKTGCDEELLEHLVKERKLHLVFNNRWLLDDFDVILDTRDPVAHDGPVMMAAQHRWTIWMKAASILKVKTSSVRYDCLGQVCYHMAHQAIYFESKWKHSFVVGSYPNATKMKQSDGLYAIVWVKLSAYPHQEGRYRLKLLTRDQFDTALMAGPEHELLNLRRYVDFSGSD